MLVVADSSALLALASCEGLPLLDPLFQDVWVPSAVFAECTVVGRPHSEALRTYLEGKINSVDLSSFVIAAVGLGTGELEAMALYKHLGADRLLVDDDRARRVARINQIEVIGSIGVLLLAKIHSGPGRYERGRDGRDRAMSATASPRHLPLKDVHRLERLARGTHAGGQLKRITPHG